MKKVIVVHASVKETKIEEFLKLAKTMIVESLSESGCLSYKLSKDTHTANEFFFYEKYKDEKAIEIHRSSAHFKSFINAVMPLLIKEPLIENFNVSE